MRRAAVTLVVLAGLGSAGSALLSSVPPFSMKPLATGLSVTRTANGQTIAPERLGGSDYCGNCHTQIYHEWNASMHHFSSLNNPVYRRVSLTVSQTKGPSTLQFCAGCHDPVPLLAGETASLHENRWSSTAGITCLVCHRISSIHGGNGGYEVTAPFLDASLFLQHAWLQPVHKAALALAPGLHRNALSKPFYASSEYCAACHTLTSPVTVNGGNAIVLQDELGELRAAHRAGHSDSEARCIDCHMPLVPSRDPAGRNGKAHSHRFPGGNTAVPLWNRDQKQLDATEQFLRSDKVTARCVSVSARSVHTSQSCAQARVRRGEPIELRWEVHNSGVGHSFPAGTTDSNQAWIEFIVTDAKGVVLAHEGAAPPERITGSSTVAFGTEYVDLHGQITDRRTTATDAVKVRASTVLRPNEARQLRYAVQVDSKAEFPLRAVLRINWRKYPDSLMAWVFESEDPVRLPVTILHSSIITLQED